MFRQWSYSMVLLWIFLQLISSELRSFWRQLLPLLKLLIFEGQRKREFQTDSVAMEERCCEEICSENKWLCCPYFALVPAQGATCSRCRSHLFCKAHCKKTHLLYLNQDLIRRDFPPCALFSWADVFPSLVRHSTSFMHWPWRAWIVPNLQILSDFFQVQHPKIGVYRNFSFKSAYKRWHHIG